jgi:hypothetical protein
MSNSNFEGANQTKLGRNNVLYWLGNFIVMVIGMAAKVIYDHVANGRSLFPERTDIGMEIIIPLLISPMIFGGVYRYLQETPKSLGAFVFSFQNGFFWKSIFTQSTNDFIE